MLLDALYFNWPDLTNANDIKECFWDAVNAMLLLHVSAAIVSDVILWVQILVENMMILVIL